MVSTGEGALFVRTWVVVVKWELSVTFLIGHGWLGRLTKSNSRDFAFENHIESEDKRDRVWIWTWSSKKACFYREFSGQHRNVTPCADVENQGELERECVSGKMIRTGDSKTGFLATWNVLCIDPAALVTANIAVELGVANGREVIIREVTPDPRDTCGWSRMQNQVVNLSRPPKGMRICWIDTGQTSCAWKTRRSEGPLANHGNDGKVIMSCKRVWRYRKGVLAYTTAIDIGLCAVRP